MSTVDFDSLPPAVRRKVRVLYFIAVSAVSLRFLISSASSHFTCIRLIYPNFTGIPLVSITSLSRSEIANSCHGESTFSLSLSLAPTDEPLMSLSLPLN